MTVLGMSLLLVGAIVIVIEAHVPTLGVLGAPGVIALAVGAVLAVSGLGGGLAIGLLAAFVLSAVGLSVVALSVTKGAAVRKRQIRTGPEGMIGHIGVVRSWSHRTGSVLVDGGLWRARLAWPGDEPEHQLNAGDEIVVERLNGLTLAVRRAEEWELAPW
jgi:membrane-bound ClpP family serine protease